MAKPQKPEPKRRRDRGDDGIYWDKINKCYLGTISLGYDSAGKRIRRRVRGKTKAEVKDKLAELHDEIKADVHTPATYTVRQCVGDWLDAVRPARARLTSHPVPATRKGACPGAVGAGAAPEHIGSTAAAGNPPARRHGRKDRHNTISNQPPACP
jgi:hypothetical protein